ncbi:hypothetical protein APHAL10511_005477 [Amanita phalloides]|nr:hypothetical protein APHAL10511_005477 [Amanita phalloides]
MADEEKKWRDAQLPISVEGAGLGNERQGGDEPMDVDVSEEEESDGDIIEGCYSLEIDIMDFEFPRIWIRAEYIRIYDALEAHYRKSAYPYLPSAVVITGQPGIGKSVWIYYALRRRLAERKPVIWYLDQTRYLFVEEGVYKVPDEFKASHFQVFIWTLVDSDEAKDGVPNHLVTRHTRHSVIYCTSPSRDRWSRLHKTVHNTIVGPTP